MGKERDRGFNKMDIVEIGTAIKYCLKALLAVAIVGSGRFFILLRKLLKTQSGFYGSIITTDFIR